MRSGPLTPILIAILVVCIIYIFYVPQWEVRREFQRHTRVVGDIHALRTQLDSYKKASGAYPAGLGLLGNAPKDPWGQEYVYRFPGSRSRNGYDLFSAGPDRKPDTADDDWGE